MSEKATVETMIPLTFALPSVPNFLRTVNGECWDLRDIPVSSLEAVGKAWIKALMENAERRRRAKP